ncbi:MAG: hypothetical protein R3E83_05525 [Burkholderiaceae bacterium]
MRPRPPLILERVAELLSEPANLVEPYARAQLLRAPMLVRACVVAQAKAIPRLHEEIDALRSLFSRALPLIDEPALCERLADELGAAPASLDIADLETRCDAMRTLLIRLHAWVDQRDSTGLASIRSDIWAELRMSTERRRTGLDRF